MTLAVAGRVRLFDETPEAQLKISIATPSGVTIEVTNALVAAPGSDTRYGGDRRQVLFVLNTQLPIDHLGTYKVAIFLESVEVRELIFEVVNPPDQTA